MFSSLATTNGVRLFALSFCGLLSVLLWRFPNTEAAIVVVAGLNNFGGRKERDINLGHRVDAKLKPFLVRTNCALIAQKPEMATSVTRYNVTFLSIGSNSA